MYTTEAFEQLHTKTKTEKLLYLKLNVILTETYLLKAGVILGVMQSCVCIRKKKKKKKNIGYSCKYL